MKKRPNLPEGARLQYLSTKSPTPVSRPSDSLEHASTLSYSEAFSQAAATHTDVEPKKSVPAHDPASQSDPVAILVCHGMGEQVRYQTLGDLAAALLRTADPGNVSTVVTLSRPINDFIVRAEISWTEVIGGKEQKFDVHLYEAYWAPITEGRITYVETLGFLFSAAGRGMRYAGFFKCGSFQRWMFGQKINLQMAKATGWKLLAVCLVLTALVLTILGIALMAAAQLKLLQGGHLAWPDILRFVLPFFRTGKFQDCVGVVLSLLFWAAVAMSYVARNLIVQYAGDVAAYISPYKASKFQQIRNDIQKVGFDVASLIYGFTPAAVPQYKHVLVVGHSLGSVLAYDTLNAMINLDQTNSLVGQRDVIGRTKSLITFGSPLDKTAFLFRNQANNLADPLREQMVAASQPLIATYASRSLHPKFRWINIFSPADIISSSLDYYDDKTNPDYPVKKVVNRPDPQAKTWIMAHTQYWENDLLHATLLEELRR